MLISELVIRGLAGIFRQYQYTCPAGGEQFDIFAGAEGGFDQTAKQVDCQLKVLVSVCKYFFIISTSSL